ncbi:MAG: ribbon-helix-helix protein, CopG family [Romboutsia timonensis]|uniref:ribbon-helix-helix protein, CopG family n=1 Tax=Romboutsia timonensis TaxID=1776391 RepID=UPI003992FA76
MFSKKETRTERVTFRLSKDELQKLDEISEKLKEKRSDFIRIAVLERINKKK